MTLPEIWAIEKPVPLTAEDLKILNANSALTIETKVGNDGLLYAERFIRAAGWVRYEEDKNPTARFIF